jgi:hypothetical protein
MIIAKSDVCTYETLPIPDQSTLIGTAKRKEICYLSSNIPRLQYYHRKNKREKIQHL